MPGEILAACRGRCLGGGRILLCTVQSSRAQCECTLTELLVLAVSYSNRTTIATGITGPHQCWCPCASGWSPSGWSAVKRAPAWAETVPSKYAGQSPFSCPSDVPEFNKRNKLGHLDVSKINTLNVNTEQTCFTNKQRMQFCFVTMFFLNTVGNDRAESDLMTH